MKSTDVIISGGGIPGLTLGILLVQAGLKVAVCDPSPLIDLEKIALSGRTIAVMENSLDILRRAGIAQKIEAESEELKTLSVVDEKFQADFHSREIGMDRFGQNVQLTSMQAHAASIFKSLPGALLIQDKLETFDVSDTGVQTILSNGEKLSAKILIGADGRNSLVRKNSGIEIWEHDYKQNALTGVISHTKSHKQASTEFHYAGGPFTLVPMKNNMCSFVWMEKTPDAERISKLSKSEIEALMQKKSRDIVGNVSLITPLSSHPIKIQKAKRFAAKRVALIAEAAHVLSPIGAQGLNLSLRDVAVLFESILNSARLGLDIGSAATLKPYETERFTDISMRVAGTDALNRTVATDNNFLNGLRRLGFKAATNIAPLRSLLMHEALAPTHSILQDIVPDFATRATVKTSTRAAPAA